jgi:hypothetical protein
VGENRLSEKAEELVRRSTYRDDEGRIIYERGDDWVAKLCAVHHQTAAAALVKLVRKGVIADYTHTKGGDGRLRAREKQQAASRQGQESPSDNRHRQVTVTNLATPLDSETPFLPRPSRAHAYVPHRAGCAKPV